jgi:hypothetical protein
MVLVSPSVEASARQKPKDAFIFIPKKPNAKSFIICSKTVDEGFSHFARHLSRAYAWLKGVPPGRGRQAPETLVLRAPKDLKSPSVRREKFTAATRTFSAGFQVNAFTYQSRAGTDERRYSARTPFARDMEGRL